MAEVYKALERAGNRVLELFHNGNIDDAVRKIAAMQPAAAAWVGAYVLFHGEFHADRSRPSVLASESFWMRCLAARVDLSDLPTDTTPCDECNAPIPATVASAINEHHEGHCSAFGEADDDR